MPKMWMLTGEKAIVVYQPPFDEIGRYDYGSTSIKSGDNSYMLS